MHLLVCGVTLCGWRTTLEVLLMFPVLLTCSWQGIKAI